MRKTKVNIRTDSAGGFFNRVRSRAKKLDRREALLPELIISFEEPMDLFRLLTPERLRLLQGVKQGSQPRSALATELRRDAQAVGRDVSRLEKAGLLRPCYQSNLGRGRSKFVESVAKEYNLVTGL